MTSIDTIGLNDKEATLAKATWKTLRKRYAVSLVKEETTLRTIHTVFTGLSLSPEQYYLYVKNAFQAGTDKPFYVVQCLLDFGYTTSSKSFHTDRGTAIQYWGYARLNENFGDTLIRPINQTDKLVNNFIATGVPFGENEKFNRQYYVMAVNNDKIKTLLVKEVLQEAAKHKNLSLYIKGNELVTGFPRHSYSTGVVLAICEMLVTMAKHFVTATGEPLQ